MKRVLFFASLLAMFAQSCANEEFTGVVAPETTTTISVDVELDDETRTYLGADQKIHWAETGEQLNVIYYADDNSSSRRQSATHSDYTIKENGSITFTADFTTTDGATSYTLGAFYPYAYKFSTASISLYVPQEQHPTADSFDPATDILVSKEPIVVEGTPEKVNFTFARMVAFAKMTLKGIGEGETIEKVTFYSSAKPAGAMDVKVHEAATVENAVWYNNYEDITITRENWVATGEDVVWMTTVPTDLSDTDFTVTVVTDKYTYTKEVDLTGKTLNFKRADVAVFTVKDLVRAEKPKGYKLLTDINELNAGDQIVIATKYSASSSAMMLSVEADDDNPIQRDVTNYMTISNGPEILPTNIPEDAAIFDVESGATAGTFALKEVNSGYLYGAYDTNTTDNTLSFKHNKDVSSSWVIEILTDKNNKASIKASYDGTEYRYLNNYYGSRFNYSASLSSSYHYYIYYLDGENSEEGGEETTTTPLATPVVTATAEGDVVTVAWEAITGAKDYTVTCGEETQTVEETTATFEGLAAGEYEVTVVANPADATLNTASEAGKASVTVEESAVVGGAYTIELTFPLEGASGDVTTVDVNDDVTMGKNGSGTCAWRSTGNGDEWNGIFMGTDGGLNFSVKDSEKHQLTKIVLTAVSGGSIKTDKGDGSEVVWEGESGSVTFKANGVTKIASATIYYKEK